MARERSPSSDPPGADHAPLDYRQAGVDVDAGLAFVERIKPLAAATRREGVVSSLGGFGALFELPLDRYRDPLLVSGTDGVGTKLRLALEAERYDTVGIDLVAMCANDILAHGAEPLFFLDYYATGRLDIDLAEAVVAGIAEGCRRAGMALIGGETAEMPGMYHGRDFDLAGFAVGIVERDRVVDGRHVRPGDRLLGLASSGPHANGYSLVRRVLERSGARLDDPLGPRTLGDWLLEPTRIYVADLQGTLANGHIKGIAHITGGGLVDNVARILPEGTGALVEQDRWPRPEIFEWIRVAGDLGDAELHRTFNCGIGLVVALAPEHVPDTLAELATGGVEAFTIGHVVDAAEVPDKVTVR